MRVLVSTFREGDVDKLTLAMRHLSYDRLVLVTSDGDPGSGDLDTIKRLEDMAGHEIRIEVVDEGDFLALVEDIAEALSRHFLDPKENLRNSLLLNISGGSKLLGDAALLAAFRLGIETYHCENRVTKLPLLAGATAKDRFTPTQLKLVTCIADGELALDEVISRMAPASRPSAERVIRELKRLGLLRAEVRSARVFLSLSGSGREVFRSVQQAQRIASETP